MRNNDRSSLGEGLRAALSGPLPGPAAHASMLPAARGRLEPAADYLPSAVLVAILEREGGPSLLLIERTGGGPHGGQIAFPGGKAEAEDSGPVATALREAREEVGLEPASVEVLGLLSPLSIAVSGFRVQPVVGLVGEPPSLRPNPEEVAAIIELPLDALINPGNRTEREILVRGEGLRAPCYVFGDLLVWGATAMILAELQELLAAASRQSIP